MLTLYKIQTNFTHNIISYSFLKEMTNESEVEKQQLIQRIENLNAFYLFCKQSFKEAMDLFLKLETGNNF